MQTLFDRRYLNWDVVGKVIFALVAAPFVFFWFVSSLASLLILIELATGIRTGVL